jgi:hypothetical protein
MLVASIFSFSKIKVIILVTPFSILESEFVIGRERASAFERLIVSSVEQRASCLRES